MSDLKPIDKNNAEDTKNNSNGIIPDELLDAR